MKAIILVASFLLLMTYSYAVENDPCSSYKQLQKQCLTCRAEKTCSASDRVYCAQLKNYGAQCYYYNKGLESTKNQAVGTNYPTKNKENKANNPDINLQDSFDTATPEKLQNNLHLYKNDITNSRKMPEVVAPKPSMPKNTPKKAPSATENILKSWY
jgi:hypothetical protein